jgi:acetyl-CoA C-acetyltransferase
MQKVAIASYSTGKFRKDSKLSLFELACQPCIDILKKSKMSGGKIDSVLFSTCSPEYYSSSILSEMLGISPRISHRVESLCNSGTNAIVSAFSYISSGLCDSALVVGAEKSGSPANRLIWDVSRGSFTFPVLWAALFANSHMRKYGTTEEDMAFVSVKNHMHAERNLNALFRQKITLKDVMESRRIAGPIKLLDCSYICDGSSAVLLLSEDKAKEITSNPVWIKGIGQYTTGASFNKVTHDDMTTNRATKMAAQMAYDMAEVGPDSIDIAELHDAFTILQILAYEDLGFTGKGKGGKFVHENNDIVINPRGGILGCGHALGATGIAQTAEVAAQLTGKAGKRQAKDCKTGLVHNLAAAGTSATVIILGF